MLGCKLMLIYALSIHVALMLLYRFHTSLNCLVFVVRYVFVLITVNCLVQCKYKVSFSGFTYFYPYS